MSKYEVIAGNIGTVYRGESESEARKVFAVYADKSKRRGNRCFGEDVCIEDDGYMIEEYAAPRCITCDELTYNETCECAECRQ